MTQAITVKYLPPTGSRGARLKATCYGGSTTEGRDFSMDAHDQAPEVAKALARKMGWGGAATYAGAYLPNGDQVFLLASLTPGTPEFYGFHL